MASEAVEVVAANRHNPIPGKVEQISHLSQLEMPPALAGGMAETSRVEAQRMGMQGVPDITHVVRK